MAAMSLRQYAKHRGVALAAVQKAIKTRRIPTLPDGRIESTVADEEWERNTMTYAPAVTRRTDLEEEEGSFSGASQYTKARAVREHYHARLAKIDYEERVRKLVSQDEVRIAAFNKFRQFRDRMLNIPDRLAAVMAAEPDAGRCYDLLAAEVRRALDEFADANG
ncbi:MAG TPA: hypothetical protein VKU01_22755 [Bryobacteraceae bacterium]|nr:hypothetical protein [Bryobacteraceae bacterium]